MRKPSCRGAGEHDTQRGPHPGVCRGVVSPVDLLQIGERLFVVLHLLVRLRPPHQRPRVAGVQLQRCAALVDGLLVPVTVQTSGSWCDYDNENALSASAVMLGVEVLEPQLNVQQHDDVQQLRPELPGEALLQLRGDR